MALGYVPVIKIDFGKDPETTHNSGNRVPVHSTIFFGNR